MVNGTLHVHTILIITSIHIVNMSTVFIQTLVLLKILLYLPGLNLETVTRFVDGHKTSDLENGVTLLPHSI